MIEPFYFGPDRSLFGIYQMAVGNPRGHGLLIASPLLNEGVRAQFALKMVADRCVTMGFDVLRFDCAGLGNSAGLTANAPVSRWVQDIISAASELDRIARPTLLSLVAVRFAANLARELAQSRPLERVVLWDPVPSGESWLGGLRAASRALPEGWREAQSAHEYQGHGTHEAFAADIAAREEGIATGRETTAVLTQNHCLGDSTDTVREVVLESDCRWDVHTSDVLFPTPVVDAICEALR